MCSQHWDGWKGSGQKNILIAANGLDPLAAMHVYSLGVQPCLNYAAHAIDLSATELRALDTTHANIFKWLLGLCTFCRSPLFHELLAYKKY